MGHELLIPKWPLSYRLVGDNPALAKEFSNLLASCGFVPFSGEPALITIILHKAGDTTRLPSGDILVVESGGLRITKHAERIFFSYRSWNLELDFTTLTIHSSSPDPDPGDRLSLQASFLLTPLLFIMHRFGYFELHAAACAYHDSGYLLLGPSGSGKTTATLSLIASGWKYLSDDAMVVSADPEGTISVRPLRRSFSLKPDHLDRHPELASCAMEPVPNTNKRRFDPRQVWPEQYTSFAIPRFIIACKISHEETSDIAPIPRIESLAQLVGSTPSLMFDQATAPAQLDVFRSLAATSYSFELKAGRDLFRNGERFASLIAPDVLREKWLSMNRNERWL
jgi:hypothetical protein